jgi:ATP-dependent Clp protease ATP-binding subunit ClpC
VSDILPVFCWRLPDGLVVGKIVGTDLMLARDDERAVTSGLAAEVSHLARETEFESAKEARLVRRVVDVRPTWLQGDRRFVASTPVPLALDVVISRTSSGFRIDMPRTGRSFGIAEEELIDTLVTEEIVAWARDADPSAIYAELRAPAGWLTSIPARRRERAESRKQDRPVPDALLRVAEREPARKTRRLEPGAWSREAEVALVVGHLLAGRNVVLVGDGGVGKSTILREAIAKAAGSADSRTFWRTTTHRIVAGARYLGEWQEKADEVANALAECEGTLWIEDLAALFTFGGEAAESLAAYWRRPLLEKKLHLAGELTPRAWDVLRAALPDVARAFEVVRVGELGVDATRAIVDRYAELVLASARVGITAEARRRAIRLLERFVRYERFPGKAIRFVRALADDAERGGRADVTDADVVAVFERRTGLPRDLVDDTVPLTAKQVEERLGKRIVGQPAALSAVTRVLLGWKAGLNDPDRPVSTLLFAGPTGVGKTATARALADLCYGAGAAKSPLVRVDMSELGSPWQVERLLGSRREPGPVIRQIRERPFGVVLFDEIEKAHPLFFDLLLGVLDEGRLVDAIGRETDLRGCILIMTTNLGTRAGASLGFGPSPVGAGIQPTQDSSAIRGFFRPEFFNRIDEVVHFGPLDREGVRAIARRELEAIAAREGIAGRGLGLRFTEAVVDRVVAAGFDPLLGARPLQRAIEQQVVAALARLLVDWPDGVAVDLEVDAAPDGTVRIRQVPSA